MKYGINKPEKQKYLNETETKVISSSKPNKTK